MWRSTRLARKALVGGAAKFRAQVHQSCETLPPPLSSFRYRNFSGFTSFAPFKLPSYPNLRFYSSDPCPDNDEFHAEKPVIGVRNDYEENSVEGNEGEGENVAGAEEPEKTDQIEDTVQKLEDLLSLLQSSGYGKSLKSSLEDMGLPLNEEFLLRVRETPFILGENLIGFFKWVFRKCEILVPKGAIDALVQLRAGNAYALWDLVKQVGEKDIGIVSTETLIELLSLFSRLGKGKVAFEVFNKFEDFGCVPDANTYYFTIDALCKRMIFGWGCSVCEKMISANKVPENEKVGKIVSHLCKGKKLEDAHAVYLWAKDRKIYPSRSSVNFLISSLCGKDKLMGENKGRGKNETHSPSQAEVISQEEKKYLFGFEDARLLLRKGA